MEELWTLTKEVVEFLLPHWPFVSWFIATMVTGQFMKHAVWTKQRAYAKGKWQSLWWWGYKSMVLHGAVTGMFVVAPLWPEPYPGINKLVERMAYFGLAGFMGVAGYRTIKELGQKRGVNISLPGIDDDRKTPSTPPPADSNIDE